MQCTICGSDEDVRMIECEDMSEGIEPTCKECRAKQNYDDVTESQRYGS